MSTPERDPDEPRRLSPADLLPNKSIDWTPEQIEIWNEDLLLWEAAGGDAGEYWNLLENKNLLDVWRILAIKRTFNYQPRRGS